MEKHENESLIKKLLVIAVPMVISQASDTLMLFVDRLFLSRLGEEYLAASMSGGLMQLMLGFFFIGTIGYVTAVVAQYYGAGNNRKCAEATVQAMILALISYPVILALSPLVKLFFSAVGQTALQVELGFEYFQTLIFGIIFLIMRHALAGFFIGIGRTTVVMAANAAGMIINIPINYILIYGKAGFPALGLKGAAIGTVAGNFVIFIIMLLFYFRGKNRVDFCTNSAFSFRPGIMKTLLRYGTPAGVEMFLNIAAFNLFVQTMHSYGTKVAAAVTIAFNWDIVAFLPMLGMGHAVTSLVGRFMGAGMPEEAGKTAYTGLKTAWVYSFTMVMVILIGAKPLANIFLSGFADGGTEVADLAVVLLRLVSVYILADSAQIVFVGALRGAGDTRWVMIVSVLLHWVFAAAAIYLIRFLRVEPVIAWLSFIVFIMLLGITMFLRFRGGHWRDIKMIDSEAEIPRLYETTGACTEIYPDEPVD